MADGSIAYGSQVAFEIDALGSSVNNIVGSQVSSGANIADNALAQITTAGKVSGAAITLLASLPSGAGVIPAVNLQAYSGGIIQTVNTQSGAVATGTTSIPFDDTIPQITEGTEFMTRAITPNNASNLLKIDVTFSGGTSTNGSDLTVALFQDATLNALAAANGYNANASQDMFTTSFTYYMTAGTTSSTTFRIRAGTNGGSTVTFNGFGTARKFGGIAISSITITELKA